MRPLQPLRLWRPRCRSSSCHHPSALLLHRTTAGAEGRGELHPHSDIDLLILAKRPGAVQDDIAAFVRLLWDLKLDIGHSVRTLADCKREAARDVVVYTTMMERRRLAGSHLLTAKLDKILARRSIWPRKRFFLAKQEEQHQRHRQYDNVDYDLEPNLKGSPGGLRDIQTVLWITQHDHQSRQLDELVAAGFLTPLEAQWLAEGRRFIWRVRFGLHLIAERKEDRLLFDYQRELATRFGYRDTDAQLGVEQFMHDYYRHVLLREVNDILLQHFDEAILRAGEPPRIEVGKRPHRGRRNRPRRQDRREGRMRLPAIRPSRRAARGHAAGERLSDGSPAPCRRLPFASSYPRAPS